MQEMEALVGGQGQPKKEARLWVKQIVVYEHESRPPIRTVGLKKGINVIWACEPEPGGNIDGMNQAGHGVGKTSFCLLVRHCLGDNSKATDQLKEQLSVEFPNGGVAATVSVDGQDWAVYRPFGKNRRSWAFQGDDIQALFDDQRKQAYEKFESYLSGTLLNTLESKAIPETGQTILWKHILNWLTRDQTARFLHFYHWREGEGNGLARPKLDPPVLFRIIMGIMSAEEVGLQDELRQLKDQLLNIQSTLEESRKKPSYLLARIDLELRAWGDYAESLAFHPEDLLQESVLRNVAEDCESLKAKQSEALDSVKQLEDKIDAAAGDLKDAKRHHDICQLEMNAVTAVVQNNQQAFNEARQKREKLLELSGYCPVCDLLFSQCKHVQDERESFDIRSQRDQNNFSKLAKEYADKLPLAQSALAQAELQYTQANNHLADLKRLRNRKQTNINEMQYKVEQAKKLIDEFEYWEKQRDLGDSNLQQELSEAQKLQQKIELLNVHIFQAGQTKNSREKRMAELVDQMSKALLGDSAFGFLESQDTEFPFKLSLQGGEAYRVLSVLLGDFASLIFSTAEQTAFPGFLIHDCPREADMSEHIYHQLLNLLTEFEEYISKEQEPPFQYIVTTTSKPPERLCKKPYLVLELKPDDEKSMLFRKRFGGYERQVIL